MPADTSILMGFRGPQIESQDVHNARAAQMMQAQQQNILAQMQMGEMARATQQKNAMRDILSKAPEGAPDSEINRLIEKAYIGAGDISGLITHRKTLAEAEAAQAKVRKEKAQTREAEAGTTEKEFNVEKKRYDHSLTQLSNAHNVDEYIAKVNDSRNKKYMSPEQADQALKEASDARTKDILEGGDRNYQALRRSYIEKLIDAKDKITLERPTTDVGKLIFERDKLPPNDPNRKIFDDAIKKATSHAPANNITLSTEKSYGGEYGKKTAESDINLKAAAEAAPTLAESSNRISQILKSGKVFTGTGAEFKLQLAKALKVVANTENEAIANTETLISSLAGQTLANIKSSGLGSGQGFTDKDREFLQAATAGTIALDNNTLQRLSDLSYRTAVATADKWSKRVKEIPKSVLEGTGTSTARIDVPPREGGVTRKPSADRIAADKILSEGKK